MCKAKRLAVPSRITEPAGRTPRAGTVIASVCRLLRERGPRCFPGSTTDPGGEECRAGLPPSLRGAHRGHSPVWPPAAPAPPASGRALSLGPPCRRTGRPLQVATRAPVAPPPWRLGVTWPRSHVAAGVRGASPRPRRRRAGVRGLGGAKGKLGWESKEGQVSWE